MITIKHAVFALTLLATGLSGVAHADGKPEDIISSEVNLTRDMTQKFLRDLMGPGSGSDSETADFEAKARVFSAKVDTTMQDFEAALKGKILPQIALYVNAYNSTYSSKAYSSDQKRALMTQILTQLNSSLGESYSAFDDEITKLVQVTGINPNSAPPFVLKGIVPNSAEYPVPGQKAYVLKDGSTVEVTIKRCDNGSCTVAWPGGGDWDYKLADLTFPYPYDTSIFPVLADSCFSISCITLSSLMTSKYLQLLKYTLATDLNINLADGQAVVLAFSTAKRPGSFIDVVLSSITSHAPSADVMKKLPFSVNQAELQAELQSHDNELNEALAKEANEKRSELLTDLTNHLKPFKSCGDILPQLTADIREIAEIGSASSYLSHPLTDSERQAILASAGDSNGFLGIGAHKQARCLDQALQEAK